ncbi:conserved Plasmodium protein, unknown function [Plasmodium malariae]|uniref:DUF8019 domain-containing protein n=1 Tax=Plasmodium malariae TaxID=5858 RepID=A0A1C3KAA9_PLAMA|nr:conserved Plasmodium protein, unknown function [Plasmodium malariae]
MIRKIRTIFFFFFFANIKLAKFEKSLFNYLSEISFSESFENLFEKCLQIPNTLCLGGTTTVISPPSVHKGLIAHWTFDDVYALDSSSNNNHMHKLIRPAPSFNGRGHSGAFIGDMAGFVPAGDALKTVQVFWIYLLERSTSYFRNVISQIDKGEEKIAVLLHPHITKLSVRVTGENNSNEGLSSMGYIPLRRWTNIAIRLNEEEIEIYINGVYDNSVNLKNRVTEKGGDINIGKNKNYSSFNGYLDEIYFYNRSLHKSEIKSFSIPSITGIYDTDFVYVGNYSCNYMTAKSKDLCKENYKLCTLFDLYNGAIHYARVNGILTETANLWTSEDTENSFEKDEKRIALCCKIYDYAD